MFSGLISHLGRVASLRGDLRNGMVLTVEAPDAIAELLIVCSEMMASYLS